MKKFEIMLFIFLVGCGGGGNDDPLGGGQVSTDSKVALNIIRRVLPGADVSVPDGEKGGLIESSPPGILCGDLFDQCSHAFDEGTEITLISTTEQKPWIKFKGYLVNDVVQWPKGSTCGQNGQEICTFKLTSEWKWSGSEQIKILNSVPIVADWTATRLTVSVRVPSSQSSVSGRDGRIGLVTSSVGGIDCWTVDRTKCSADFEKGTNVTLKAEPGPSGFIFDGWTVFSGIPSLQVSGVCDKDPICSISIQNHMRLETKWR